MEKKKPLGTQRKSIKDLQNRKPKPRKPKVVEPVENTEEVKEEVTEDKPKFKGRIKPGEMRNPNAYKNLNGGRKPGSTNHITKDIKEAFKKLIEDNVDNMTVWLDRIAKKNPDRALKILIDVAPYVVPKLATTEIKVEHKNQYDLSKLSDAELNELVKLSEKCSIVNNNQNSLKLGGSEFLEKNDDINEH